MTPQDFKALPSMKIEKRYRAIGAGFTAFAIEIRNALRLQIIEDLQVKEKNG